MKKIIISPKIMHPFLLNFYRKKDPFIDVKVISKESLLSDYKGKASPDVLPYLIKKHGYKYDNASALIPFLPFINESLPDFFKLKNELVKEGLIKANKYLDQSFKDGEILIAGYSLKDKELIDALNELKLSYKFINNEHKIIGNEIVKYETAVDEVFYSLNKIASLIDSGVSTNDIYICVNSESYSYYLEKFASDFGFMVDISKGEPLFNYSIASIFLKEYMSSKDIDSALEKISEIKDKDLLEAFIEVINECRDDELEFSIQCDYIVSELKRTIYHQKRYKNVIRVINSPIFTENAHIFVLGFAQGSFPKSKKDNQLLSDAQKEKLGINTSLIDNECLEDMLLSFFSSDNNFYFSYSERSLSEKFLISPLAALLGLKEVSSEFPEVIYSKDMRDFYYAKALDLKNFYQEITPEYYALGKISHIPYGEYHNDFTGVKVYNNVMDLEYSYSKINMYYQCPFQYYVSRVLKVDPFEDNFNTKFGSVVHKIFEHHNDKDFDFDSKYEEYVNEQNFLIEELPIVSNLKEQVKEASEAIMLHQRYMKNPYEMVERNIRFNISPHTSVNGKIDKLLILDKKYLAIVDYKTGNSSFNSKNIEHGDSLQLPTYCFLVENDKALADYQIMGVFINNVIDKSLTRAPNDESLINPYFRLNGKVVADDQVISYLDNTISGGKCEFIKGVTKLVSGDGFRQSANLSSFVEIKEYARVARQKFIEADEHIRNNEFPINPLFIGSKGACDYCQYNDICYVKPNQRKYAEKVESEDDEDE